MNSSYKVSYQHIFTVGEIKPNGLILQQSFSNHNWLHKCALVMVFQVKDPILTITIERHQLSKLRKQFNSHVLVKQDQILLETT